MDVPARYTDDPLSGRDQIAAYLREQAAAADKVGDRDEARRVRGLLTSFESLGTPDLSQVTRVTVVGGKENRILFEDYRVYDPDDRPATWHIQDEGKTLKLLPAPRY